jgi:hypothetical protein
MCFRSVCQALDPRGGGEQWLSYANSTRFASTMMGADYGVFANGRWYLSKNIHEMIDWLEFKLQKPPGKKK